MQYISNSDDSIFSWITVIFHCFLSLVNPINFSSLAIGFQATKSMDDGCNECTCRITSGTRSKTEFEIWDWSTVQDSTFGHFSKWWLGFSFIIKH